MTQQQYDQIKPISILDYVRFCKVIGIKANIGRSIGCFIEVCQIPRNYEAYRKQD
mgnify:CR=1 FL=1